MQHLYVNNDTDIVAADSAEQARLWFKESGGLTDSDAGEWTQLPDDKDLTVGVDSTDSKERKVTQTCKQWAEGELQPTLVCTTNY